MALFDLQIPDSFEKTLGRLADVEKFAPAMLEAAAPILEKEMVSGIVDAAASGGSGFVAHSVKIGKPKYRKKDGSWYISVYPTGTSSKYHDKQMRVISRGSSRPRNAEVAAYLEYGTSTMSGKPFMTKAKKNAEPEVLKAMQEVYEKEAIG